MKRITILLFFCAFFGKVFSTNQMSDILIWNQDTLYLYNSPLEIIPDLSEKLRANIEEVEISSDCWNGFYAEWEIIDNTLYLTNIYECNSDKNLNSKFEKILNRKFKNGLMKADWVNTDFWCGKNFVPEQTLYISIFKHEYNLNFINAKLEKIKESHYLPCKFKTEDDFLKFILPRLNWNNLPSLENREIDISIYLITDKTGKVVNGKIENSSNPEFNSEVLKVARQIPCLTVYFNRGKFWNVGKTIDFTINKKNVNQYLH